MSSTVSFGSYGPSYWSYMANIMADRLLKVAEDGKVDPAKIPRAVYRDALKFFALALDAADDEIPDDPPASYDAYRSAMEAVSVIGSDPELSRRSVNTRLRKLAEFNESLVRSRALSKKESRTADELGDFFLELAREADEDVYEESYGVRHWSIF